MQPEIVKTDTEMIYTCSICGFVYKWKLPLKTPQQVYTKRWQHKRTQKCLRAKQECDNFKSFLLRENIRPLMEYIEDKIDKKITQRLLEKQLPANTLESVVNIDNETIKKQTEDLQRIKTLFDTTDDEELIKDLEKNYRYIFEEREKLIKKLLYKE